MGSFFSMSSKMGKPSPLQNPITGWGSEHTQKKADGQKKVQQYKIF